MSGFANSDNLDLDNESDLQELARTAVRTTNVNQTIQGVKTFENVIIHDLSVNSQTTFSTEDGIIHQLKDNVNNDLLDYGNYATYNDGSAVKYKGLINKAGTDKFYLFNSQLNEPSISLNLNSQSLSTLCVREPIQGNEVATKQYVESHGGGSYLPLNGGTLTGDLNMGNNDITNIENLTFDGTGIYNSITFPGANRLTFVDTDSNIFMHLNSLDSEQLVEIMKKVNVHGDITMLNSKRILGLLNPISNDEPANKSYADTKLSLDGGIINGDVGFSFNNRKLLLSGKTGAQSTPEGNFITTISNNDLVIYKGLKFFALNNNETYTNQRLNMSNNNIINCNSISSGTQTLTSTNDILSTYENVNVNSYLFETPNSQVCKLALKTQSSGFNDWIGKAMIDFQVDMAGIRDIPSGRIVSTPDFPQFVFQRAFMDFYNCWDFNPSGEDGELLHMMRFSDIIRMYRNMDMSGNSIKNMSDGFDAGDGVNKSQLDTKLNLAGGSMTGNINMNTGVLRFGAGNITSTNIDGNAVFTRLRGGNGNTVVINENQCEINTDLNMLTNKIVNVGTPSAGTDVANKAYVDANAGPVVRYINFTENGWNPTGTGRTFLLTFPSIIPDGDYFFEIDIYLKYQDPNNNADGFKLVAYPTYVVNPTHQVETVFDIKTVQVSTVYNTYGSTSLKWFDTRTSATNNSTAVVGLIYDGGSGLNFDVDIRGKLTKI